MLKFPEDPICKKTSRFENISNFGDKAVGPNQYSVATVRHKKSKISGGLLGLMSFLLGVILFGRSACQPAHWA